MNDWVVDLMKNASAGGILLYPLLFAGGVLASFTPCTYPVLPLTVGYIGQAASRERGRGIALSLALVAGMASVYAVMGVIFAAAGLRLGEIWSNGWAVFAIAWFFLLMSLYLLDVFTFPVPRFLQDLSARVDGRRRGLPGAFLVGAVSGLVVGPCTGPILAIALVSVSTTLGQAHGAAAVTAALSGGLKLFVFGLGQGALILLAGSFAGFLARLPKSGRWMAAIKKAFALAVMAGASLLFVYVGQGTRFPDLTSMLAGVGSRENPPAAASEAPAPSPDGQSRYGGDEFLDP
jgi:cytochrome c-type biogenesis protein